MTSILIDFLITCCQNLGYSVNYLTLMRLGKDKQAKLLAVFLLLSASAGGQPGKTYKYHFNGDLQMSNIVKSG